MTQPRITRYSIGVHDRYTGEMPLHVEETDHEKGTWAIRDSLGHVLSRSGRWTFEPSPSNRTDKFLSKHRWTNVDEALQAVTKAHARMLVDLEKERKRREKLRLQREREVAKPGA